MKSKPQLLLSSEFKEQNSNLRSTRFKIWLTFKLQLHDAIYHLRFYSNSLIHILSLSNWHSNVASLQKNRGDESHHAIIALLYVVLLIKLEFCVNVANLFVSFRFYAVAASLTKSSNDPRELYLGLLYPTEDYKVYPWFF